MRRPVGIAPFALALALACAAAPPADTRGAAVWGWVRLVPKSGTSGGGDAYADRRVRDAAHVDYSHPKFAVVFAAGTPARAAAPPVLAIEDGPNGPRWAPALAAVSRGGSLEIVNRSASGHVVSAPLAGFVRELAPGESATLAPADAGELEIHTLHARSAPALVWVAPGAFAIAGADGRYELRGLPPGPLDIRAWHPRLPPTGAHALEARAGEVLRLDLEIGVDQIGRDAP